MRSQPAARLGAGRQADVKVQGDADRPEKDVDRGDEHAERSGGSPMVSSSGVKMVSSRNDVNMSFRKDHAPSAMIAAPLMLRSSAVRRI